MLEITELAVRLHMVTKARPAGGDGIVKDLSDGAGEAFRLRALGGHGNAMGAAFGRDAGQEQAFTDIDVAEPGNHMLIEERRLDRGFFAPKRRRQGHAIETIAEGFGPEVPEQGMVGDFVLGRECHEAETPGIVEPDQASLVGLDDDMVVASERRGAVPRAGEGDHHASRHAQMDDPDIAIIQPRQNIFATAVEPPHAPALKPGGKILRKRDAEILTPEHHPPKTVAFQDRGKAAANGLDFRQFGHDARKVAETGPVGYVRIMETGHIQDSQARRVRAVFDAVAGRYDLMNDLMSAGIHRLWKAAMIDWLAPRPGIKLVDIAGGTGDIAFRVIDRLGGIEANRAQGGSVTVMDVNPNMLEVGRKRDRTRGLGQGCRFVSADAERLPIPDSSVDAYTVAFGLRNVSHMEVALAEAHRVLKPGGRFLCLEFSHVAVPLLGGLYDRYSFAVLPWLGEIVTANGDAYRYLVESIRAFPPQDEFAAMIEAAGLDRVRYRNLTGGIAALHSAWRI